VANEILVWIGPRGRHRSPGEARSRTKAVRRPMRNLALLPRWLRFFAEPFEPPLAASAVASGTAVEWGGVLPPSLAAQLTPWEARVWGVLLIAGGLATLWARWRISLWQVTEPSDAGLILACRFEMVGMMLLATASLTYGLAILAVGLVALQAAAFTLAWGGACGVRAWIVSRQVRLFAGIKQRAGAGPDV
jgi:hypothetical protein